jgi:prevent-host-death family protein
MAKFATVRDLKNQTTALIRQAEKGKAVVITRRGKPVATLKPFERRDVEADERYPTSLYDSRKESILAKHPELKSESPEAADEDSNGLARKLGDLFHLRLGRKWIGS